MNILHVTYGDVKKVAESGLNTILQKTEELKNEIEKRKKYKSLQDSLEEINSAIDTMQTEVDFFKRYFIQPQKSGNCFL
jgi:uncharacterized FlaG/YvyC family protein